jgi:hypothetical protein
MASICALVMLAVSKHLIAGIVVIVVGALIGLFGAVRAVQRMSGAALTILAGLVIVVIGILVVTHTIHP